MPIMRKIEMRISANYDRFRIKILRKCDRSYGFSTSVRPEVKFLIGFLAEFGGVS